MQGLCQNKVAVRPLSDNSMAIHVAGFQREEALGKPVFQLFEIPGTSHVRGLPPASWCRAPAGPATLKMRHVGTPRRGGRFGRKLC